MTATTAIAAGAFAFTYALQHFGAGRFGGRLHHVAAWGLACAAPNGLAAHGDGLCLFTGFGRKALYHDHFNVLLGKALNVLHEAFFVQADQVDGSAIGTRAAGAADAVHIVFAHVGDFVVHHVRQIVNVDSARSNVGRNQCTHFAAFEASQCLGTGGLALVAMQRHGRNAVLFQKLGHVVGAEFGAGEHQHLAPVLGVDDVRQQSLFLATTHGVDHLGNALHRGVAGCDLHALRVFEQVVGQLADFVAEGGREQQALFVARHQSQHFFHVMDKAHVQHTVGFIEHQDLHLAQIQHALLLQVQQAAGGGDQQVHAFFELGDLRVHAHTAKDDGAGEFEVLAVGADRFFDLRGQFAGGGQHQGTNAHAAEFVFGCRCAGQALQHGQGEGRCFASASLGAAQQVVASEHQGNGLGLNGRGRFIALLEHSFQDGRSQVQFFEVHKDAPVCGCLRTGLSVECVQRSVIGR